MRDNPYLKNRSIFLPLLMRGSNQGSAISTTAALPKALFEPSLNSYSVKGISFEMIQPPRLDNKLISLPNVEMCSTECTQELFEAVMGFNPSGFKGKADSPKRPIEQVSWFDCIAFCNKLSQELGLTPYYSLTSIEYTPDKSIKRAAVEVLGGNGFRLPTEAEWELFAKAGTNNKWSGTNIEAELKYYAWDNTNSKDETHPIATKKPNEWGMYDMSGNVWEWCWDTYTSTSAFRVYRGGSWFNNASRLRSAIRDHHLPSNRFAYIGFRVSRSPHG